MYLIIPVLVSILLPILLKSPKVESDDGTVKLQFSKVLKIFFLIGYIIFFVIFIITSIEYFKDNETCPISVPLIFSGFMMFVFMAFMFVNNKKILIENNNIISINCFGKKKTFNLKDIKKTRPISNDGLLLILNDNSKVIAIQFMSNYDKLINILKKDKLV